MLPLLCAAIVFGFLVVGAVAFVFCGIVPPLRRYSLSTALWFAVWGPCSIAWLLFTGLVLVANTLVMQATRPGHVPLAEISSRIWTVYGLAGVITIGIAATLAAVVHQWLIHRITLRLFRLYAVLVSAGVGSVWGWTLWFGLQIFGLRPLIAIPLGLTAMLVLCLSFGYAGWRWTPRLRGNAPLSFAFITREEFEGSA
jgi:hypothetical protein